MADLMELPFDADQEQYDAWQHFHMARVNDPNDPFDFVDLNDGVMVFATARLIYKLHPDKVEALKEHTPSAIAKAMDDLGIFMGVTYLAGKIGIDPQEARQTVFAVWGIHTEKGEA